MKRLIRITIIGVAAIALAACGSDDTDADAAASAGFAGGSFQLTTHAVKDNCDVGLELLFMPNGADKPYDLANKTEFPPTSALPSQQTIALQAPFENMDVEILADGDNMKIVGAKQIGITVDASKFKDCTADMTIDADITIASDSAIVVNATVTIEKFESAGDDECPKPANGTPCTVILTMQGAK